MAEQSPVPRRAFDDPDTARMAQVRATATRRAARMIEIAGRGPLSEMQKARVITALRAAPDLDIATAVDTPAVSA